ncbi:hypothetical protein Ae201684P_019031 [Aphanomyces euteiches]|nr:hypothetical protein Ae201684P_019031 [Aphanomyces euteiches]
MSTPAAKRKASEAILRLAEADVDRQRQRNAFIGDIQSDSDDEADSPCPVFDLFYHAEGNEGIRKMSNFNASEFNFVWSQICENVDLKWNCGRGERNRHTSKDVFFMFMAPFLYDVFVYTVNETWSMEKLRTSGNSFQHYPSACYATDVTFQQTNMPAGNLAERKRYFSKKHHLYGYKVEVSVAPNGLALNCTKHYPGNESDIGIFCKNFAFHDSNLLKLPREESFVDEGPLKEYFPNQWIVLVDKGYQGLSDVIRALHPKKKPPNASLSRQEHEINTYISSDRVIVENFFGRLCTLWAMCSDKFRWNEELYDTIFRCGLALTNAHILKHPLRARDGESYACYTNPLSFIGNDIREKRAAAQESYRRKRRLRLESSVAGLPGDSGYNSDDI